MAKVATFKVSVSTDTRIDGRYFADLRVGNRQTTRVTDAAGVEGFLNRARELAEPYGVTVVFTDETADHELSHLS
jgi:hypothetical protein